MDKVVRLKEADLKEVCNSNVFSRTTFPSLSTFRPLSWLLWRTRIWGAIFFSLISLDSTQFIHGVLGELSGFSGPSYAKYSECFSVGEFGDAVNAARALLVNFDPEKPALVSNIINPNRGRLLTKHNLIIFPSSPPFFSSRGCFVLFRVFPSLSSKLRTSVFASHLGAWEVSSRRSRPSRPRVISNITTGSWTYV
jgi:hypothetical protein